MIEKKNKKTIVSVRAVHISQAGGNQCLGASRYYRQRKMYDAEFYFQLQIK